jgi:predicted dehydrogenase
MAHSLIGTVRRNIKESIDSVEEIKQADGGMTDARPLQLGVIGPGQRWHRRYLPALHRLKALFQVVAVADQVQQQAAREAKQLQCTEARGVLELIRHPEVHAVLLADPQWFGLWPVQVAAQHQKPVFCGIPLSAVGDRAEVIGSWKSSIGATVMVDLPLQRLPMLAGLKEVCATYLGQVKWLLATLTEPLSKRRISNGANELVGAEYLDFCLQAIGGVPTRILTTGLPDQSLINVLIECDNGRAAQLTRCLAAGRRSCQLAVVGENGAAVAELPGRLRWRTLQGSWSRAFSGGTGTCRSLLRDFHRAVTAQEPLSPDLHDAYRAWKWQQLALESWNRGLCTEATRPSAHAG